MFNQRKYNPNIWNWPPNLKISSMDNFDFHTEWYRITDFLYTQLCCLKRAENYRFTSYWTYKSPKLHVINGQKIPIFSQKWIEKAVYFPPLMMPKSHQDSDNCQSELFIAEKLCKIKALIFILIFHSRIHFSTKVPIQTE